MLLRVPKGWIALGLRVVSVVLLFLLSVLLARWLGAEGYGYYALITVWVNLSVLLVKGGLDTAALRFIPAYGVLGNRAGIRGYVQFAIWWITAGSALLYVTVAVADAYRNFLPAGVPLWLIGLLVLVMALSQLRRTILLAYRRLVIAELPESIAKPLVFCVMAGASFYLGYRGDVLHAVEWSLLLTVLGLLVGGTVLWRLLSADIRGVAASLEARVWLGTSLIMLMNTGLHQVIKSVDILILGGYRGAEEVAAYAAATRVADLVVFGLSSLNLMIAPRISAHYTAQNYASLQVMLTKASWFVFVFALAVFLVFCLAGEWLLGIYGESFKAGFSALLILAAAQLFNSSTGSVGFLLSMTGRHRVALYVMLVSALVSVPMYYVLIPLYGGFGAAIASAAGIVIWNMLMLGYSCMFLGLNPSIYSFIPVRNPPK